MQLATLVVTSWPRYPDIVAIAEEHAAKQQHQPSIEALAATPFLPLLPQLSHDPADCDLLGLA